MSNFMFNQENEIVSNVGIVMADFKTLKEMIMHGKNTRNGFQCKYLNNNKVCKSFENEFVVFVGANMFFSRKDPNMFMILCLVFQI